ncbi:hypothetical protein [Methylobacterium pseudosasicola]|uniref:Uncharacterized protein n=1 Tax=Methylobacterium pseudosasicola TaxID=582667 RepID=A0A1I4NKR1_9HYPH|nr:hypothetical protein [Methylobacterium pseudosasicola]SFM16112.1 hypothetical protein SAMN05192568_102143 [Methylobacterium pseudosasicola]
MAETATVVMRAGAILRPVLVWSGTRTRLEDRLVAGFAAYPKRPHYLDAARTTWRSEHDLPVGVIVTTGRSIPWDDDTYLVTADGLQPLTREQAWDMLDPAGAEDRAAQRAHDAAADAAGLPATLTRFVGAHSLQNGVHRTVTSAYFAERCTARQAFMRRATWAEVAGLAG